MEDVPTFSCHEHQESSLMRASMRARIVGMDQQFSIAGTALIPTPFGERG
jgi:hypothetical protein